MSSQSDPSWLTSQIYQYLIGKLTSGEFSEGTHLNAAAIAKTLQASRSSVRKVIHQLIEQGWVEINDNRHPIVKKLPQSTEIQHGQSFEFANQTDRICCAIHNKILQGEYSTGEMIRANQLATEFGVSLVTVRQALDWLCRDGLLKRIPRRGWKFVTPTLEDVKDIYACRMALEPLVLKKAAHNIKNETIDSLIAECDEIIEQSGQLSEANRLIVDMKFHYTLIENARSPILDEVVSPLIRKRTSITCPHDQTYRPHTFADEHKAILLALREKNVKEASRLLRAHLQRALNTFLQQFPQG